MSVDTKALVVTPSISRFIGSTQSFKGAIRGRVVHSGESTLMYMSVCICAFIRVSIRLCM